MLNYLVLLNYVFYEMYMMYIFVSTMLTCIKLHIEHSLFQIGIEMKSFCHDDDEDFLHNIISEGTHHQGPYEEDAAEYDGSEYLNDNGDGDANQLEEMTVQDVSAEVYRIRGYIYKHLHEFCMYVQCVVNRYFSRHPNRVGNQNGNEGRRKLWRGILSLPRCTLTVNQSLQKV